MCDRGLSYFFETTLSHVPQSGVGNIEPVNVTRIGRGLVTQVEACPAPGIEDPEIRFFQFASRDRVCYRAHGRKPPIILLESIQQLEVLLVHEREITSSVCDTADNIRRC